MELVLNGNNTKSSFKPVDFVVVRGKKVKFNSAEINEVLECSWYFIPDFPDLIKKKDLKYLTSWLATILFLCYFKVD